MNKMYIANLKIKEVLLKNDVRYMQQNTNKGLDLFSYPMVRKKQLLSYIEIKFRKYEDLKSKKYSVINEGGII